MGGVRAELRRILPVLIGVTLYALIAVLVDRQLELGGRVSPRFTSAPLTTAILLYYPLSALAYAVWLRLVRGTSMLDRTAWSAYTSRHFSVERIATVAILVFCVPVVASVFTGLKASIPVIQPFSWDPAFMRLDRWLHFGRHPWELLQPILGTALATRVADLLYFLWFPVVWFTIVWQLAGGLEPHRTRFLLTFVLATALLGSAAAIVFSSAGPCYYDRVVAGPSPFEGLFAQLGSVGAPDDQIRALWGQDLLWRNHTAGGTDALSAISAFPSMHVAMVTLLALVTWRIGGVVRWLYIGYAGAILVGSVHLGWHYAVDGYVSILATILLWWLAGLLVRPDASGGPPGDTLEARRWSSEC